MTVSAAVAARARSLLLAAGRSTTAEHSARVTAEVRRLAEQFGVDLDQAVTAACLHDISAIHGPEEYVALAEGRGLTILPEERIYPGILHQKLSAVIAGERFVVTDAAILTAISCHTTLRADAADLDMILYAADKLAWDQSDAAPYEAAMRRALKTSLPAGVLVHLRWMHDQRASLRVVHPWLRDAYEWLAETEW